MECLDIEIPIFGSEHFDKLVKTDLARRLRGDCLRHLR